MAKCYYCGDEVSNDDFVELDGDWLRICPDCREFITDYGTDKLDEWLFGEGDIKERKHMYRQYFDKKLPNSYNNSKC